MLLALLAAMVGYGLYLIGATALDKAIDTPGQIFLVSLAVASLASGFILERHVLKVRRLRSLARPRPIACLCVNFVVFLSGMAGIMPLFEPRPATTQDVAAVDKSVNELGRILTELRDAVAPRPGGRPRIAEKIAGHWGRLDCTNVYHFTVQGEALIIDWVRRPAAQPPYQAVATIVAMDGDEMRVVGDEPESARGHSSLFTYSTNGRTERLMWDDQDSRHPTELDRCA